MDVAEHEVGVAGQAFVRGRVDGMAPAALVEGGDLDGIWRGGKGGKEGVVGVAVVAEGREVLVVLIERVGCRK